MAYDQYPRPHTIHTTHSMCSFGSFRLCNIKYLKWKDDTQSDWERAKSDKKKTRREKRKQEIHTHLSINRTCCQLGINTYLFMFRVWLSISITVVAHSLFTKTDMLPMSVLPFPWLCLAHFASHFQLFAGRSLFPPLPMPIHSGCHERRQRAAEQRHTEREKNWKKIRVEKYNFKHSIIACSSLLNFISILLVRHAFSSILRSTLLHSHNSMPVNQQKCVVKQPICRESMFLLLEVECQIGTNEWNKRLGENNNLSQNFRWCFEFFELIIICASKCLSSNVIVTIEHWTEIPKMAQNVAFSYLTTLFCRFTDFELGEWHLSSDNMVCLCGCRCCCFFSTFFLFPFACWWSSFCW